MVARPITPQRGREAEAGGEPSAHESGERAAGSGEAATRGTNASDRERSRSSHNMRRQDGSFCHDPLGLEQLQPQSVPEHQVLWLRVLEAVDAGMSWPSKRRMQIQMAARLSERVQGILAQFDHREITLTLLGMHAALQLVSQGLQQMVLDRVESLEPRGRENTSGK